MQIANAWIKINELGSNCQVKNITPAEAQVLRHQFGVSVPGQPLPTSPFTHLDVIGEIERSAEQEYTRLAHKFGSDLIKQLFSGANPSFPDTFKASGIIPTDEKGEHKALPTQPAKGKEMTVVPLAKLPKDDGSDLEPAAATTALATEQAKQIAALQTQVAELLKLVQSKTPPPAADETEHDS